MISESRAVRSLPIEFWFSRPQRRRNFSRPLLRLAGLALLGAFVGWLLR
jgi:hypothetical protein